MNYEPLFQEIKRRGKSNVEAIKTHHDCVAGTRGAFGKTKPKSSLKGLACPRPAQARRDPISFRLPVIRVHGTPLKCNGYDGYTRDPATGSIRRVVRF